VTTTENPIMEYLHTILERTDQLLEDVSDLRHRMAKLEQAVLQKKNRVTAPLQPPIQRNVVSSDPDHIQRLATSLGISEASVLLRVHRMQDILANSSGKTLSPLDKAEAQLLGLID